MVKLNLLFKSLKITHFSISILIILNVYLLFIHFTQKKNINIIRQNNKHNFKEIALKYGTDKVTTHFYDKIYDAVLEPIRNEKLNVLEIGLGCDMEYGPGKSILLWKEFLPNSKLSILELNKTCASKFNKKVENMYIGDQSDLDLLKTIGKSGGLFNIIIDDGGHSRKQQVNSLIGLWPFVENGGIYIIEDFFTSFIPKFNDNLESPFDLIMQLIILFNNPAEIGLNSIFPDIEISDHAKLISKDLISINCFHRACALKKK